jgi:serine/threonine protein kinase
MKKYQLLSKIGGGRFGSVKLARQKATGKTFAIKILEKNKIGTKEDTARILIGKEMTTTFDHLNVIKTFNVDEDPKRIYFIMEYCEKGDLLYYIYNEENFDENKAAYYFYQLINGLENIHYHGICHRDLRPENLLINSSYILKIIDFDLCNCYDKNNLLSTPCGSPNFLAPEMLNQKKYDGFISDIWCTGVILFEMLCHRLPFSENDKEKLFEKISKGEIVFPHTMSKDAKDLVKQLLEIDPNKRITIPEIKKSPFYLKGKSIFAKNHPKLVKFIERKYVSKISLDALKIVNKFNPFPTNSEEKKVTKKKIDEVRKSNSRSEFKEIKEKLYSKNEYKICKPLQEQFIIAKKDNDNKIIKEINYHYYANEGKKNIKNNYASRIHYKKKNKDINQKTNFNKNIPQKENTNNINKKTIILMKQIHKKKPKKVDIDKKWRLRQSYQSKEKESSQNEEYINSKKLINLRYRSVFDSIEEEIQLKSDKKNQSNFNKLNVESIQRKKISLYNPDGRNKNILVNKVVEKPIKSDILNNQTNFFKYKSLIPIGIKLNMEKNNEKDVLQNGSEKNVYIKTEQIHEKKRLNRKKVFTETMTQQKIRQRSNDIYSNAFIYDTATNSPNKILNDIKGSYGFNKKKYGINQKIKEYNTSNNTFNYISKSTIKKTEMDFINKLISDNERSFDPTSKELKKSQLLEDISNKSQIKSNNKTNPISNIKYMKNSKIKISKHGNPEKQEGRNQGKMQVANNKVITKANNIQNFIGHQIPPKMNSLSIIPNYNLNKLDRINDNKLFQIDLNGTNLMNKKIQQFRNYKTILKDDKLKIKSNYHFYNPIVLNNMNNYNYTGKSTAP